MIISVYCDLFLYCYDDEIEGINIDDEEASCGIG